MEVSGAGYQGQEDNVQVGVVNNNVSEGGYPG